MSAWGLGCPGRAGPLLACDCPQLDGGMAPTVLLLLLWLQGHVSGEWVRGLASPQGMALSGPSLPAFPCPLTSLSVLWGWRRRRRRSGLTQ